MIRRGNGSWKELVALAVRFWEQILVVLREQGMDSKLTQDSVISMTVLGLGWVKYNSGVN